MPSCYTRARRKEDDGCILAVDDDEAIRNLLGRVLGKDGHDVRCAACAEEALALKLDRYDLVLLDVMMPGTDGFELCRAIRGSVDAPIVFLTARSSEDDAVYGLGLGADDYLRKPFGAAELRAKVAAHLAAGAARAQCTRCRSARCGSTSRRARRTWARPPCR